MRGGGKKLQCQECLHGCQSNDIIGKSDWISAVKSTITGEILEPDSHNNRRGAKASLRDRLRLNGLMFGRAGNGVVRPNAALVQISLGKAHLQR
ncbi:hypothetical protein SLIQ_09290 [Serratia liquefaciens FK01]|nr:hypothetical protein SLIQ_09290 [Serratia liquefaciens FK01]